MMKVMISKTDLIKLIQRLSTFKPKSPLLRRPSSDQRLKSYGVVRDQNLTETTIPPMSRMMSVMMSEEEIGGKAKA